MEASVQSGTSSVSASVFGMLLAGVVGGGVVGLVLGSVLANQIVLAILCAFIGAVLGLVIGYAVLGRDARVSLPSGLITWNVIVTSLFGGLAGHELSIDLRDSPPSPLVGALSGLLAAILIASFAITIHMLRDRLSKPQM
jgi:hypothetical protein